MCRGEIHHSLETALLDEMQMRPELLDGTLQRLMADADMRRFPRELCAILGLNAIWSNFCCLGARIMREARAIDDKGSAAR